MLIKNVIVSLLTISVLSISVYAKQNDEFDKNTIKNEKPKKIPPGLEKKETLPPGWQKKLEKGQIAHYDVLRNGVILTNKYPKIINTDVYQVENRIFRIYKDTKEILDIIK
ncbi:hypothetical protein N5915_05350 [Arcobacter lacus]|uniref:hypothetical protein n=1 Tax=Arcobacter lacus TaxID=1912876 RepID=UPI0021BA633F|nr:hypothetical protein [Arcobacter lacus]MCT7908978.1 hypothetical protein [Arcobacter lacus]